MEVIVNRIEGNYLVLELENGKTIDVSKELIPEAEEGDIVNITIDKNKTNMRKKELEKLVNSVFKD